MAGLRSFLDTAAGAGRTSPAAWRRLGWLHRGAIACRLPWLPLTLCSTLLGALQALPWTPGEGGRTLLVSVTVVFAHAAANLWRDALGWLSGRDGDDRLRLRYGAHPLAQGLMPPAAHALLLLATGIAAFAGAVTVCRTAGPPAYGLALVGSLLLMLYAWPLERMGLGEPVVFLGTGPLLVGGAYWVVSGDWGPEIGALSLIAGLGPAAAVMAAHADRRRSDAARGIRTLPVVLGPAWGPRAVALLAVAQVAGIVVWVWIRGEWTYLLIVVAMPALARLVWICLRPRPTARPRPYPADVWPSWYAPQALRFAVAAGLALVLAALLEGL